MLLLAALSLTLTTSAQSPAPAWWVEREVVNPAQSADNSAVANIGQLKHLAAMARLELMEHLPAGPGQAIDNLVAAWQQPDPQLGPDDFAAANIGQAKTVAKLFYDRLGLPYPWAGAPAPDDHAVVTVGQLKHLFSMDIQAVAEAMTDTDGDGVPDVIEIFHGSNPNNPLSLPPLQLTLVSGSGQTAEPDSVADQPLKVKVTSLGYPIPAVPVTFEATPGDGSLSQTSSGSWLASVAISTASDGIANAFWQAASEPGSTTVTATVTAGATPIPPPVFFALTIGGGEGTNPGGGDWPGQNLPSHGVVVEGGETPFVLRYEHWELRQLDTEYNTLQPTESFVTGYSEEQATFGDGTGVSATRPEWLVVPTGNESTTAPPASPPLPNPNVRYQSERLEVMTRANGELLRARWIRELRSDGPLGQLLESEVVSQMVATGNATVDAAAWAVVQEHQPQAAVYLYDPVLVPHLSWSELETYDCVLNLRGGYHYRDGLGTLNAELSAAAPGPAVLLQRLDEDRAPTGSSREVG